MDLLFEVGVFGVGLGIEVAGLRPDLAALASDLDLDVVIAAVPFLVDGIAEDVVGPGQALDLIDVLLDTC